MNARRLKCAGFALLLVVALAGPNRLYAGEAQTTNTAQFATRQARFELAYESMTNATREYVNDALKTIGFLLLAAGWLVSSDRSRKFLRESRRAHRAALVVVPLAAVIHVWLALGTYRLSQSKVALLENLDYMPAQYFAEDAIRLPIFIANLALHLALFATLLVLILAVKDEAASSGEQTLRTTAR